MPGTGNGAIQRPNGRAYKLYEQPLSSVFMVSG